MSARRFDDRHVALTLESLHVVVEEFEDALGRRPKAAELGELIAIGFTSSQVELLSDTEHARVRAFRLSSRRSAGVGDRGNDHRTESVVFDITDAVVVAAVDMIHEIAESFQKDVGEKPQLSELCAMLLEAIHASSEPLMSDVANADITKLSPVLARGKVLKAVPGDVLRVQDRNGASYACVVLSKDHFGTAYGFFMEPLRDGGVANIGSLTPLPYAIYSGDEAVGDGRWRIVGHDERALSAFPPEPEIYHSKNNPLTIDDPNIGPYGAAETSSGRLRQIGELEAHRVGLHDGTYEQTYIEEHLEEVLPTLLARGALRS